MSLTSWPRVAGRCFVASGQSCHSLDLNGSICAVAGGGGHWLQRSPQNQPRAESGNTGTPTLSLFYILPPPNPSFSVLVEESNFQPDKPTSPKVSRPGKTKQGASAALVKEVGQGPRLSSPSRHTSRPAQLLSVAGSSDLAPKRAPRSPWSILGDASTMCLKGQVPPWTEQKWRPQKTRGQWVLIEKSPNLQ